MEALVLDALDAGARLAQGRGVTVRAGDVVPAVVTGDSLALGRALLNLVDNAVRYTPAGGKVEVSARPGDGWVEIAVQDTGLGIAPADAERVFQPFVRLEGTGGAEGTGLGLAIARSIVVAHGGTLTLRSTPGAGSRFSIRLPRSERFHPFLIRHLRLLRSRRKWAGPGPDAAGPGDARTVYDTEERDR